MGILIDISNKHLFWNIYCIIFILVNIILNKLSINSCHLLFKFSFVRVTNHWLFNAAFITVNVILNKLSRAICFLNFCVTTQYWLFNLLLFTYYHIFTFLLKVFVTLSNNELRSYSCMTNLLLRFQYLSTYATENTVNILVYILSNKRQDVKYFIIISRDIS